MARRGKFGRAPRPAQNLTNTLVAIARDMQRQRDQNLMDAWQKGGTFEGQEATDELVLKHWSDRMKNVAKNDPLYDTYKNAHLQYDYAIHESKMTVKYAKGEISDSAMANFYLNWSKKVPVNSEFFRVLQRDAAQFMRSAKSKGAAAAAKAKEDAYQKAQFDTHKGREAAGEYMLDTLRALAQRGYADQGIGPLIGGPGSNSDLPEFDSSDPEQMLRLLGLITPETRSGPTDAHPVTGTPANGKVLMHDDMGNPITGADIIAKIKSFDPKFDGTMDLSYVQGLLKNQMGGIQERIDRATKTGHASDVAQLQKQMTYVGELGREVNAWPVEQDYMRLRQVYQNTIGNPAAMPGDKVAAWEQYQQGLQKLSSDPRIAADDNFRSRLVAEANMEDGAPTLAESFAGLGAATTGGSQDIASNKFHIEQLQAQVDAVAQGSALWTTGVIDKDGVFTPQPGGSAIGAATPDQIRQVSPVEPKTMYIPGLGGKTIPVAVTGADVKAQAVDAEGHPVKMSNANPVASVYQVTINGQVTQVFGFQVGDGSGGFKTMYSADPPWDQSKVGMTTTSSGIMLNVSNLVPPKGEDGKFVMGANGFALETPQTQKGGVSKSTLTMDPSAVVLTSDSTRLATGGFDPATDFFSPTLAALMGSPDGRRTLGELSKDKTFRDQLDFEAHQSAGFTLDSQGMWVGGNAALYSKYSQQGAMAVNSDKMAAGLQDFVVNMGTLWSRDTTIKSFQGANEPMRRGPDGLPAAIPRGDAALATDKLAGTAFAVLGEFFKFGTNNLKPALTGKEKDDLAISLGGTIKVPAVPAFSPSMPAPTAPTVGPTVSVAPPAYTPPPDAKPPQYQPPSGGGYHPPGGATAV